jgi:quercetin dioxygenase-like cupin family protein
VKKLLLSSAILALVFAAASAVAANGQAAPKVTPYFPAVTFQGVQTPARYFDLVQSVVDYDPGTFSARESVQYVRFFTVVEGTLTATIGDKTDAYGVGKYFSVPPGILAKLGNQGSVKARVYISGLKPAWALQSVVEPGSAPSTPGPRVVSSTRHAMENVTQIVNVIQVGSRYDKGYTSPTHVMNQPHAIIHAEGTTAYEYFDGGKETYTAGQGAQMYVGRPGLMRNAGTDVSGFLLTWLQTPGAPLTTPMAAPGAGSTTAITPPSTGEAGLVGSARRDDTLYVLAGLIVMSLMAAASRQTSRRI